MDEPNRIRGQDFVSQFGRLHGTVRKAATLLVGVAAAMLASVEVPNQLLLALGALIVGGCYSGVAGLVAGVLPLKRTAWRRLALWLLAQAGVAALVLLDRSPRYLGSLVMVLSLANLCASAAGLFLAWRLSGVNTRLQGWLQERYHDTSAGPRADPRGFPPAAFPFFLGGLLALPVTPAVYPTSTGRWPRSVRSSPSVGVRPRPGASRPGDGSAPARSGRGRLHQHLHPDRRAVHRGRAPLAAAAVRS